MLRGLPVQFRSHCATRIRRPWPSPRGRRRKPPARSVAKPRRRLARSGWGSLPREPRPRARRPLSGPLRRPPPEELQGQASRSRRASGRRTSWPSSGPPRRTAPVRGSQQERPALWPLPSDPAVSMAHRVLVPREPLVGSPGWGARRPHALRPVRKRSPIEPRARAAATGLRPRRTLPAEAASGTQRRLPIRSEARRRPSSSEPRRVTAPPRPAEQILVERLCHQPR